MAGTTGVAKGDVIADGGPEGAGAGAGKDAGSSRPLLLFDSVCGLCNGFVTFVEGVAPREDLIRFEPLQSDLGKSQLKRFGLADDLSTVVLVHRGRHYVRSSAALTVMWLLGFPWALLYIFMLLPRPIRDWGYKFVAANRYRWFGKVREEEVSPEKMEAATQLVNETVEQHEGQVVVFAKTRCPFCKKAKALLPQVVDVEKSPLCIRDLDTRKDGGAVQAALKKLTNRHTVPAIFVNGKCIGGYDELKALHDTGKLIPMLEESGVAVLDEPLPPSPKSEDKDKQ